jgi:hypothetical protein
MDTQLKDSIDTPEAPLVSAALEPYTPSIMATSMPDGDIIPIFAFDDGRSVLGLGHMPSDEFLGFATRLFDSLGTDYGTLDERCIIRRYVLLRKEEDGSITIMWNVWGTWERVEQNTPGAVAVTMTEV